MSLHFINAQNDKKQLHRRTSDLMISSANDWLGFASRLVFLFVFKTSEF